MHPKKVYILNSAFLDCQGDNESRFIFKKMIYMVGYLRNVLFFTTKHTIVGREIIFPITHFYY